MHAIAHYLISSNMSNRIGGNIKLIQNKVQFPHYHSVVVGVSWNLQTSPAGQTQGSGSGSKIGSLVFVVHHS